MKEPVQTAGKLGSLGRRPLLSVEAMNSNMG